MSSKKGLSLLGMLLTLGLAITNLGCGGGGGGSYGNNVFITISVSPTTATVARGATAQFTATLTGDPRNAGADWNLTCTEVGSNTQQVGSSRGSLSTLSASGAAVTYTAAARITFVVLHV